MEDHFTFADFWKFFTAVVLPIVLLWLRKLHEDIQNLENKIGQAVKDLDDSRVTVAEKYASVEDLKNLENRIMLLLTRIDDKITVLMQSRE